jgi:hypothetical protein
MRAQAGYVGAAQAVRLGQADSESRRSQDGPEKTIIGTLSPNLRQMSRMTKMIRLSDVSDEGGSLSGALAVLLAAAVVVNSVCLLSFL